MYPGFLSSPYGTVYIIESAGAEYIQCVGVIVSAVARAAAGEIHTVAFITVPSE
jgi:hypothetical protein